MGHPNDFERLTEESAKVINSTVLLICIFFFTDKNDFL